MRYSRSLLPVIFLFCSSAGFSQQKTDSTFNYKDVPIQLFVFMPKLIDVNYSLSKPSPIVFKTTDNHKFTYDPGVSSVISTELKTPKFKIKNTFAFSVGFQYYYYKTQHQNATPSVNPISFVMPDHASCAKISLLASYTFKVGNQPIVLSGVNITTGREFWLPNQATGVVVVSLPLRNTPQNSLIIGMFLASPQYKSLIPVPTVTYARKLRPDLLLDMYLPLRAQLRYISNENRGFIGGVKLYRDNPPQYQLDKNYNITEDIELTTLSFALFGSFEQHLSGLFWLSGEAGYRYFANSKIADPSSDFYISKNTDSFYGSMGIFMRPTFRKVMAAMSARKK